MKKNLKILLSMGIFLFAANLMEKNVWAQGINQEPEIHITEESYVNPVYRDVMQEADLISGENANLAVASEADEEPVYTDSVEEAGAQLREGMKQREENVVVYIQAPEYSKELLIEISDQAVVHTGNPVEGDYLQWQYGGWKTSTSYYEENGICFMEITYTCTYYTTAEQEAAVDEKVEEVLNQLNVHGKSDYGKVKAVYDYICAHTVYDYDHVDDTDYKLQYTAYAALIDEKAVCQGYAVLFYRVALELNLDSRLIPGKGREEAHGWNIVNVDGSYYNADSTWDAGETEYSWFLKCDENFPDHTRDEAYATEEFYAEYPMGEEDYQIKATLDAPEIMSVYSQSQTAVKVSWDKVEGADGYELYRSENPEENWILTKTLKNSDTTQYTNSGLKKGKTYYYKMRSYRINEDETATYSEYSNVAYMPAVVVFKNVYSNSSSRVRLLWEEVKGAHGYQIWRKSAEEEYRVVKTIGDRGNELTNDQGAVTAYSNTGLEAGKTYTYRMRAFAICDGKKVYGVYSDEIAVIVMPEVPVLKVSSPKSGRAALTWNEIQGSSGYQIWRAQKEEGPYSIVKSITDGKVTSYTNSGLESGKTYYYKVRAYIELEGKKTFGEYSQVQSILIP
ncbi:MAG: transglutaminase domain-containing protein [Blautia sp.]